MVKLSARARYLVGADGAKSKVVDELGLNIEGHLARAGTVYVIFKADLSRYVAHRPSILHWIVTPSASFGEIGMGLLRAVRPWDRWIAGWGFDISRGEPDLDPALLLDRIRTLVGEIGTATAQQTEGIAQVKTILVKTPVESPIADELVSFEEAAATIASLDASARRAAGSASKPDSTMVRRMPALPSSTLSSKVNATSVMGSLE